MGDRVRASFDTAERAPSRGTDLPSSVSPASQHTVGRTPSDDQELSRNASRVDQSSEEGLSPMRETDYVVMSDGNLMEGSDIENIPSPTSGNPRLASQAGESD